MDRCRGSLRQRRRGRARRRPTRWALAPLLFALASCGGGDLPDLPDDPGDITRRVLLVGGRTGRAEAIAALRKAAGVSEQRAAELLDGMPSVVAEGLSHGEADVLARRLTEAGMTTQIRRDR